MALRCQLGTVKCPSYKHQGIFRPDNETVKVLLPDLNHCAACIAAAPPKRPDLHDDLLQIASLTLLEKGPRFDPVHESGAKFGSFIRPHICGALTNAKVKELTHNNREHLDFNGHGSPCQEAVPEVNQDINWLWEVPDPDAAFEDKLVREISFADALPAFLKILTPREREIFDCIRDNQRNSEIAEALKLSESRVSQLVNQVTLKLAAAAQELGLTDQLS